MTEHRRRGRTYGTLLIGAALLAIIATPAGIEGRGEPAVGAPVRAAHRTPLPAQEHESDDEPSEPTEPDEPDEPDDEPTGPTEPSEPDDGPSEQATERAARWADATRKVRRAWESKDQPHRMAVVRTDRIEIAAEGHLTRRVSRNNPATLETLDRALPPTWVDVDDGAAALGATIVLTPGATLEIGRNIHALELRGGPTVQDAASIHTGGGELTLRGVSVTSANPATHEPLPPAADGRPSIVVSSGGRFDAVDSTISNLGSSSSGFGDGLSGVVFHPDSTGSLIHTELHRNSTGLELSGSEGVHLERVTVSESTEHGLVLSGDHGTTMGDIRAVGNDEHGVLVKGETSDRPVTDIVTSGNGGYGMVVVGQVGTRISDIATADDDAGGLRINRSTGLHVTGFTASDQPIGVFTHVNSAQLVFDHLRISGGRRGVVAAQSTHDLELRASSIDAPRLSGVSVGGTDILIKDVQVSDAHTAVRIERGAGGVRIDGLTVDGGRDGVIAKPGTTGVVLADVVATDVESDAIRTASPFAEILGGRVTGGTTGIDIAAATTISGTAIEGTEEGIRSRSPGPVRADQVMIDALKVGVNAAAGSPFRLTGSSVHALESVRGEVRTDGANDLSLPPLNLLGAIGVPLILLAVVLEQVHSFRQRPVRRGTRRAEPAVPVGAR